MPAIRQSFFVTNGLDKGRQFYVLVHRNDGSSRGLVVAWSQERHVELMAGVTAMASAFNLPLEISIVQQFAAFCPANSRPAVRKSRRRREAQ